MRTMSLGSLKIIELNTISSPCIYVMKGSGRNLQVVEAFLTRKDAEAFVAKSYGLMESCQNIPESMKSSQQIWR